MSLMGRKTGTFNLRQLLRTDRSVKENRRHQRMNCRFDRPPRSAGPGPKRSKRQLCSNTLISSVSGQPKGSGPNRIFCLRTTIDGRNLCVGLAAPPVRASESRAPLNATVGVTLSQFGQEFGNLILQIAGLFKQFICRRHYLCRSLPGFLGCIRHVRNIIRNGPGITVKLR